MRTTNERPRTTIATAPPDYVVRFFGLSCTYCGRVVQAGDLDTRGFNFMAELICQNPACAKTLATVE
jgi:hypothetical protein